MMHIKLSAPKAAPTVSAWMRQGETWAHALVCEAQDLCKMSAALDPELPMLVDASLDEIGKIYLHPSFATPEEREFFDKRSCAPGAIMRFHDEVIVGEPAGAAHREKQSGLLDDFMDGITGDWKGAREASTLEAKKAPATKGAFGWQDPLYDVTRGLKKIDEGSRAALRYMAMTPEQRAAQGVYFRTDVPALGKLFKPKPRSLREAVLLGTQEGIRYVNTKDPGPIDTVKLWLARQNAKHLATKAQKQRIHGNYLGLFGTMEDALPTWKSKLETGVGMAGDALRKLPLPVQIALGGLAVGGTALGVNEAVKAMRAKRNRPNVTLNSGPRDALPSPTGGAPIYIQMPVVNPYGAPPAGSEDRR